ncbi:ATP-binding SpoIIE family protein phosphatase [Deinococcus sp.]|uniref:ATP-binding SpoIIE family protein phosphatase n=1 Tax=Deinococcus sp. TaxID=47478 RepID=UPI003CC5248E
MNSTESALESTVSALADCYDQVVFLQQAVERAVHATDLSDVQALLADAQTLMAAGGSALHVAGGWVGPVPNWLARHRTPAERTFELLDLHPESPGAFLGVPFQGGWVAFWDKPDLFCAGDARLAQTLGDLVASTVAALDTRQRRLQQDIEEHDRTLATRIWRHLVPEQLSAPEHYRLSTLSQPASQVGGDFQIAFGNWIVVGDVSGKGIAAALFTGMFVSTLRLAVQQEDVGAAIALALHPQLEAAGMLATLAVIYLESNGAFKYLSMGHPPILIRRTSGQIESLGATAPPLGTFAQDHYPMRLGRLDPGDLLCLYSDGISEAERTGKDGRIEMFGLWKVRHTVAHATSPELGIRSLVKALEGWQVQDDLTLVMVQYAPDPGAPGTRSNVLELQLPADTAHLASLGAFVRDACHRLPHPGLPELAVTELAANAIKHGQARNIIVLVRGIDDGYLITFEDDGLPFDPTLAPELPAGELREGGYGLVIVRRSAHTVHYLRRKAWNSTELHYPSGPHHPPGVSP